MMRHLVVFWVLLFNFRHAGVQAQTVIWRFPTQGEDIQANTIDTVLLDWTSTLPSTILRMWCKNGTDKGNFTLASSFFVDSTGPFKYVMETYEPNETALPLSCHAELAADPMGSGFDSPAGIVWSSDSAQAAKTISQTKAASSVTVAVVSTPLSSSTPIFVPPSTETSAPPTSTTNSNPSQASTTDSLSQSTTSTPSTKQLATLSTKSSGGPSSATTASQLSTSSSESSSANNTGAIVGGAIGGIALLSFIILALLFLRKYQCDRASSSPIATEPSKRGFYIFNVYRKRGAKACTTGVFEKEGDYRAYEKEGTRLSYGGRVQEEDHAMRYSLVELPGSSNNFP